MKYCVLEDDTRVQDKSVLCPASLETINTDLFTVLSLTELV